MNTPQNLHYERIAQAIEFIRTHFRQQPDLEQIAAHVHLSPHHFQRLFVEWAGVSPKKFLQYISLDYAKQLLGNKEFTLFDVAHETGLSGTGRLHDLFVNIEAMTPHEYRNGGQMLEISYSYGQTLFGLALVASTPKGICYLAFADDEPQAFADLQAMFPQAIFKPQTELQHTQALATFGTPNTELSAIKLHLKGTDFQLKVWRALLQIPEGKLTTYQRIATQIGQETASRAVGTAIGSNAVAYLIPCHRVIQSSGGVSGYRWGVTRKTALLGWEAAHLQQF